MHTVQNLFFQRISFIEELDQMHILNTFPTYVSDEFIKVRNALQK